jgi:hypothetical protein
MISRGFGAFIPKKNTLSPIETTCNDPYKYDYSLRNIDINDLHTLNDIDWYNNDTVLSPYAMNLLNSTFKCIFLTLLTSGKLLTQLIKYFNGLIYYRIFGDSADNVYALTLSKHASPNVKYIFCFEEIYTFEQSLSSFFNSNNSLIVPLGCPDNFIKKHENTYKGTINSICFVCSKINQCPYYTRVYNEFVKNVGTKYEYVLLGKNNETLIDANKFNNLSDDAYFNKMSECKLMYYHSTEPRHLHYHPIEALIIGLPVLFHKESLLNSFFMNSPGKCHDLVEVHAKIARILNNDVEFINEIKKEQEKVAYKFKIAHNMNAFNSVIGVGPTAPFKLSMINCLNKQIIEPIENCTVSDAEKKFIESVSTQKATDVVFCSHLGLGDVLLNVGIINLLLNFYETVHYFCKREYVCNISTMFANKPAVRLVPVNEFENQSIISKLTSFNFNTTDCILAGMMKQIHPVLKTRIKNEHFNEYVQRFGTTAVQKTLYAHIGYIHSDAGVKWDVCLKYYDVHVPEESRTHYQTIQQYTIVFMHEIASTASTFDFSKIIDRYVHLPNYVIICANRNVYPAAHPMHAVAQPFVNLPFMFYYDSIRNATDIHVVDSCFSCIPFILKSMNAISPKTFMVYARDARNKPYNAIVLAGQVLLL